MDFQLDERRFLQSLDRAVNRIERRSEANIVATAQFMKSRAQARVPVQSGRLKRGFKLKQDRSHAGLAVDLINDVPYAGFVEFGTSRRSPRPFMRPAAAEAQTAAHSLLRRI